MSFLVKCLRYLDSLKDAVQPCVQRIVDEAKRHVTSTIVFGGTVQLSKLFSSIVTAFNDDGCIEINSLARGTCKVGSRSRSKNYPRRNGESKMEWRQRMELRSKQSHRSARAPKASFAQQAESMNPSDVVNLLLGKECLLGCELSDDLERNIDTCQNGATTSNMHGVETAEGDSVGLQEKPGDNTASNGDREIPSSPGSPQVPAMPPSTEPGSKRDISCDVRNVIVFGNGEEILSPQAGREVAGMHAADSREGKIVSAELYLSSSEEAREPESWNQKERHEETCSTPWQAAITPIDLPWIEMVDLPIPDGYWTEQLDFSDCYHHILARFDKYITADCPIEPDYFWYSLQNGGVPQDLLKAMVVKMVDIYKRKEMYKEMVQLSLLCTEEFLKTWIIKTINPLKYIQDISDPELISACRRAFQRSFKREIERTCFRVHTK